MSQESFTPPPEGETQGQHFSALDAALTLHRVGFPAEQIAERLSVYLDDLSPDQRADALLSMVQMVARQYDEAKAATAEGIEERRRSFIDPRTGLGSRQALEAVLSREGETNPNNNPDFVAAAFDARNLKAGNDIISPAFGDIMIKLMGVSMREALDEVIAEVTEAGATPTGLTPRFQFFIESDDAQKITPPGKEPGEEEEVIHHLFTPGGDEGFAFIPKEIEGFGEISQNYLNRVARAYDRNLRLVAATGEYPRLVVSEEGVFIAGEDNARYPLTLRMAAADNVFEANERMNEIKSQEPPEARYRNVH